MRDRVKGKIIEVLRDMIDDDEIEILEKSKLVTDLELSSLELTSLIAELEKEYHVEISDTVLRRMITVGDVVDIAMEHIK